MRKGVAEYEVEVHASTDGTATVAHATIVDSTGRATAASAHAVRVNGDRHDPDTAFELAAGRAVEALGRKLQRRAAGRVKQADDERAHREARRQAGDEAQRKNQALAELRRAHLKLSDDGRPNRACGICVRLGLVKP